MYSLHCLFSLDDIGSQCVGSDDAVLCARPRIVGQQADGTLLVTWQQRANAPLAEPVTYIGFYVGGSGE